MDYEVWILWSILLSNHISSYLPFGKKKKKDYGFVCFFFGTLKNEPDEGGTFHIRVGTLSSCALEKEIASCVVISDVSFI